MTFTWRSFIAKPAQRCQKRALTSTASSVVRVVDGPAERGQEPREPFRDVERAALRPLQHVVIGVALALDLRRQAVEALRTAVAREDQIPERTRNPAAAVVERMERDEPQMGEAGPDQQGFDRLGIEPREKARDLAGEGAAGGASKCTRCRPIGPDTTCIGPVASVRQPPTVIRDIPE